MRSIFLRARSSGVERYTDTVEVGGSKPPVPTIFFVFRDLMAMTKVIFSDGVEGDFTDATILDALLDHDKAVLNKTIAVRANGLLVDLKVPLDKFRYPRYA